jgi:hypothetical protein
VLDGVTVVVCVGNGIKVSLGEGVIDDVIV